MRATIVTLGLALTATAAPAQDFNLGYLNNAVPFGSYNPPVYNAFAYPSLGQAYSNFSYSNFNYAAYSAPAFQPYYGYTTLPAYTTFSRPYSGYPGYSRGYYRR